MTSNSNMQDQHPIPSISNPTIVTQGTTRTRTNKQRSRQQSPTNLNTVPYGENEYIGYILALRFDKFDKKIQSQQFLEKLGNYMVSKLKDGGDVQLLYSDLTEPTKDFQKKHKPINPDPGEGGDVDEVDLEICCEEVEQFVQQKTNLCCNLEKLYGSVWGQCSASQQTNIKGLTSYEPKFKTFNVVWLLKELERAISEIDDKAKAFISMHDVVANKYQMKQGEHESNDNYLAHFKSNIIAVKLTGGAHILLSPTIAEADLADLSYQDFH